LPVLFLAQRAAGVHEVEHAQVVHAVAVLQKLVERDG
jgi:hypothetical protein